MRTLHNSRLAPVAVPALLVAAAFFAAGCRDDHAGHDHDHAGHEHDHEGHGHGSDGHVHKAPHGGTLVPLGDGLANLEILADAEAGKVTAWVVDGCAENPVPLAQASIELRIGKDAAAFDVVLAATASALTGETVGASSQFDGAAPGLRGLSAFDGVVKSVTVKGQTFQDIAFRYPGGHE